MNYPKISSFVSPGVFELCTASDINLFLFSYHSSFLLNPRFEGYFDQGASEA